MLIVARRDDVMGAEKASLQETTFGVYLAKTDTDDFLVRLRWIKLFFLKVCRSDIADLSIVSDE